MSAGTDFICRRGAALGVTRTDENSEAICDEIFGDLKANSLIRTGDEGNGLLMHSLLLRTIGLAMPSR
jgi:hypothetical protein